METIGKRAGGGVLLGDLQRYCKTLFAFHDEFLQAAGTKSSEQGWLAMYRLPRFDQAFRHT